MAETESNVSGEAELSSGDNLSETNIGATAARSNAVDYVERGCGFSVNHSADTIDIGNTNTRGNYAIVENTTSHVAWNLFPDQDTGIALPNANATNHVFIAYNESADQIYYHIDDDDSAPSDPNFKIGTVDTANDTSSETNRRLSVTYRDVTLEQTADDGTDRLLITKADGTDMAEVYSDGTNTVINPLSGLIDLTGGFKADTLTTDTSLTDANANTIADFVGTGLSVDGSNVLNSTASTTLWKDVPDFDGVILLSHFQTLDGLITTTTGSASVAVGSGLQLDTGGTSGSEARARDELGADQEITAITYSKDSRLRVGARIVDSDDNLTAYVTSGRPQQGEKGYGFRVASGNWEGVVHNGTTENTTTLQTNPGTGHYDLYAKFTSGTDVEFIINGTSEGTISSGLPSGENTAGRAFHATAKNSAASQRRMFFGEYRYGQEA